MKDFLNYYKNKELHIIIYKEKEKTQKATKVSENPNINSFLFAIIDKAKCTI